MKHHGWIVFAIVGLVLVTGLSLMYSSGDLKTAGEARRLTAQTLPSPGGPSLTAQQLTAPPQKIYYYSNSLLQGMDPLVYDIGHWRNNRAELLAFSTTSCGGEGSVKMRVNGEITGELGCGYYAYQLSDGSIFVVTNINVPRQAVEFVHIR